MLLSKYFPNFRREFIDVGGDIKIHTVIGGSGKEAVLLLHGHPETYLIWRFIAPKLAENYTVVMTDLRGYGESSKPVGDENHENYSKRTMALDNVAVMKALGFDKFHLVGHDRGARVCHRFALDHKDKVMTLCMMDILPTDDMYADTNETFAEKYWHWFFYIQPKPFPEKLLSQDPAFFIDFNLNKKIGPSAKANFPRDIMEEYTRHFADPRTIHGICEDYRASVTIDREHNKVDGKAKLDMPTLIMWGENGVVGKLWDVESGWADIVTNMTAYGVASCGHFVPEEQPQDVLAELAKFLSENSYV